VPIVLRRSFRRKYPVVAKLSDEDRRKVFELNARRVYPRLEAIRPST
jgi:hypothetical protein